MIVSRDTTSPAMTPGSFYDVGPDWTLVGVGAPAGQYVSIVRDDGELLCVYVRSAIPMDVCELAAKHYMAAGQTVTTNRGYAAGAKKRSQQHRTYAQGAAATSGIVGYLDSPNHKRPCRLSAFSRLHYDDYTGGLPFVEHVNECFKKYVPERFAKQNAQVATTPNFRIKDTAFSTVTVNHNFRTALHKDTGDFKEGFGNISVISSGVSGGHILLPEYKVAILLQTGDYLAMNVHEYHCNSPMSMVDDTSYRLSFVCYLRDKISNCDKINARLQGITGDLQGKEWDTRRIFHDIFGDVLPDKVVGRGSWVMESDVYKLEYKNKRYIFWDKTTGTRVFNLMPAWEYVQSLV